MLFICNLLNDDVDISDYLLVARMIEWLMNYEWKKIGRGVIEGTIAKFDWRDWGKPRKSSG